MIEPGRSLLINLPLKVILFISLLFFTACGQTNIDNAGAVAKADKIDELLNLYSEYEGFNGSILVAHEGKVIYKKGFGMAQMELDVPNKADAKFRLASVTKPFTAMLIMQLVAEGKLDLYEPIATYLPDYPKKNGEQINIHHLLTHSSGTVRDYEDNLPINKYPDRRRLRQLVSQFSGLPLEFVPGERFAYSNSGYMVLGYIIETVTGKSYESVLKEKIIVPLGMQNTGVDKYRPLLKNRAKGYFKRFGDYFNSDYVDMSNIPAVGNLYSTVEDMFLWDRALHTEQILPKKYLNLAFTKHILDGENGGYYGYGWELVEKSIGNSKQKIATIGHSGALNGFCALFTRVPSTQSTIILLNNTRRAYLNTITTAVLGILNNTTYDFPKKPLAKFMLEVIKEKSIKKGVSFYRTHKQDSNYYIDENELIVAGYKLLHADNASDAAAVFKLSIEIFPDRDNPYDSFAESQMVLGNISEAIKNYKKSLELNPNNANAKEMLKKLER